MNDRVSTDTLMHTLREAGAASVDPVGWHYIEALAARIGSQPSPVQQRLQSKLLDALRQMQDRMAALRSPEHEAPHGTAVPSPLAQLLQEMGASSALPPEVRRLRRSPESPRVRQFRQQLRRISVQKQVSQAIAQAPRNAGPINSHMLVLRALGLMRDLSPEYLHRFMVHLDTLLCLNDHQTQANAPTAPANRSRKNARS